MNPTLDFFEQAEKRIWSCVESLRPKLLEAQGNIEHRLKDDKSAVTEMDTYAEAELAKALAALDSGIPFGGEESGVDFSKSTLWLVDPIDGTEPFIRGIPFATNMVTLIDNNEPVFSVIYNFVLDEFYMAIKGRGATCNGHAIHVSSRTIDRSWVVLQNKGTDGLNDALAERVLRVRKYGATGQHMAYVASGALDGIIQYRGDGHEWDFAPGSLLVQEAGGRVANVGIDTYNYRNLDLVGGNPVIFDELMEFMNQIDQNAKNTTA